MAAEQQELGIELAPAGGVQSEERTVPFQNILPPANAPQPDAGFVKNIEIWGVLDNICVAKEGRNHYRVVSGRRRWRAVQQLREKSDELKGRFAELKVDVYTNLPTGLSSEAAITLIENHKRSRNPMSDSEAVQRLRTGDPKKGVAGLSPEAITHITGMTKPQQERALRLFKLIPELKELLLTDKLDTGLAEKIAKLRTVQEQRRILKNYESRLAAAEKAGERAAQRVTMGDYLKAREVERSKAVRALPDELFGGEAPSSVAPGIMDTDLTDMLHRRVLSPPGDLMSFEENVLNLIEILYPQAPNADARKWLERGRKLFAAEGAGNGGREKGRGKAAVAPPEPAVAAEGAPPADRLDRQESDGALED